MTTLLDIDLETGNLTEFSYTEVDGGDLSASATAKLHGNYGLLAVIDDTTNLLAEADVTKTTTGFRLRFYFDPNTLTMPNGSEFDILRVMQWAGSYSYINELLLRYETAAGYQLVFVGNNDAGTEVIRDTANISDAVHYIEIKSLRAVNSTSTDGAYEWWIDGVSQGSVASVDNYNRMFDQNWGVLLECTSVGALTSGSIFFDDLFMTDTPNTQIGAIAASFSTAWARNSNVLLQG